MAENTKTLITLDNLATYTAEIQRMLKQVRAYIDQQDGVKANASDVTDALSKKVDKEDGKGLSTNDLTNELLNKLNRLANYDDTALRDMITTVSDRIDTIVGTSASEAIDNFNEILSFLDGITDTQTLEGMLTHVKEKIDGKADKIHTHSTSDITDYVMNAKQLQAADILTEEPTETTLTHTINGVTLDYQIGELVRVPDEGSETGYTFYQLHDVTDGHAVWAAVGGGGNVDLTGTIIIGLVSNQSANDSSLIGARIIVENTNDDTVLLDTTWQGTPVAHKVTGGTPYRVVFGDIDGYQTPETRQYIAQIASSTQITATYNTEVVTVTVTTYDSASVEGQQVTINDNIYTLDSTGIVTCKVPHGVTYSVSVDKKYGYEKPSKLTFESSQTSRSISMVYEVEILGVFIQDVDGKLYTGDEWDTSNNDKVNGIAVFTSNVKVLITTTPYYGLIINNDEKNKEYDNYMTPIQDYTQAIADYNGVENTANMLKVNPSTEYAAGWCDAYIFPDGVTRGHLPSLGELREVYLNIGYVSSLLNMVGISISLDEYLSSTYRGDANGYCVFYTIELHNGAMYFFKHLHNSFNVLPFARLDKE